MARVIAYRRIGSGLHGLGDSYPADFAFAGATFYWNASFGLRSGDPSSFISQVMIAAAAKMATLAAQRIRGLGYGVANAQGQPSGYNINVTAQLSTSRDVQSINVIKSQIDNAVGSIDSNFGLTASAIRFINNPRRDGATQPPVGTPGIDPRYTTVPPESTNRDTYSQRNDFGTIGNAFEFWLKAGGEGIKDLLGALLSGAEGAVKTITGLGGTTLLIVGGVVVAVLVLRK